MNDQTVFKSEIEWRSDVVYAPRDRRILVIAPGTHGNHIDPRLEMQVAHWHEGKEFWVQARLPSDVRDGAPPEIKPIYWSELGDLPADVSLRPLTADDFKG
jgi:hypothetical protein